MKKVLVLMASVLMYASLALAGGQGAAHGGAAHWGYSGDGGPEHWGKFSPTCAQGQKQSPINITGAVEGNLQPIQFAYDDVSLHAVNNGHTIQVNYETGSGIKVDNVTYRLLQFHFHSPSENLIEGRSYPLEVHLVHAEKIVDGKPSNLAVIGLMFEEGEANPVLEKLWKYMPAKANSDMRASEIINVENLLPQDRAFYAFDGSLTTPPCTEGVKWMVLKQPVKASAEQIRKFHMTMKGDTNRPVQPLNERQIHQ